jgi:hypothetical protein
MVTSKVGWTRKVTRETDEVNEARKMLNELVRQQAMETEQVRLLQRVYRGHMARKAARRWALKLAEMKAVNNLITATATTLQRSYRGHLARDQVMPSPTRTRLLPPLTASSKPFFDPSTSHLPYPLPTRSLSVPHCLGHHLAGPPQARSLRALH